MSEPHWLSADALSALETLLKKSYKQISRPFKHFAKCEITSPNLECVGVPVTLIAESSRERTLSIAFYIPGPISKLLTDWYRAVSTS